MILHCVCIGIGTYSISHNFILPSYTGIHDLTQENKIAGVLNFGYSGEIQKSLDTERKAASESYPLFVWSLSTVISYYIPETSPLV